MTGNKTQVSTTLETKEQSNGKFSIELLPIQNPDDKFSYLGNLSVLSGLEENTLRELWLKGNDINAFYVYFEKRYTENNFLLWKLKQIWINKNSTNRIPYNKISNSWVKLFKIENISLHNKQLIITSTEQNKYIGDIDKYLKEWVQALSMKNNWEINRIIIEEKKTSSYSLENWLLSIKINNKLLEIWANDYCVTNQGTNEICILKDNKIATYSYDNDAITRQSDFFDLSSYGNIKNIKTDINNNFYFITTEKEGKNTLRILNRKTLWEVMFFDDITEITYLSEETSKLFCMDTNWYLRVVTINTKNLPRGYVDSHETTAETTKENIIKIEDKGRAELKKSLSWGITIDADALLNGTWESAESNNDVSDQEIRTQIRNLSFEDFDNKTLKQLFDEAKTPKEIQIVRGILQQIKRKPEIMAVKGIMDPILAKVTEKKNTITLNNIFEQLSDLATQIEASDDDFSRLLTIKHTLSDLQTQRKQIPLPQTKQDKELKNLIKITDEKILQYQEQHREDLTNDINNNIQKIKEYVQGIDYLLGITNVYTTDIWKTTEKMIDYLPKDEQKQLRKTMNNIVKEHQQHLQSQEKQKQNEGKKEIEEQFQDCKEKLTQIRGIVQSINDKTTLDTMELSDPLVLQIKETAEILPAQKWQEILLQLDKIFKEKTLSIQFDEGGTTSIKSLDQYGIPKSLYYVPDITKRVRWDITGKPTKDGKFKLSFQSSTGNEIEPSINKKILGNFKFTYTFKERQELKQSLSEWKKSGKQQYNKLKGNFKSPEDSKDAEDGNFKLSFQSSIGNEIEPSINKNNLGNFKFTYTFKERQELKQSLSKWKKSGKQQYNKLKENSKSPEDSKDAEKNQEIKDQIQNIEQKFYVARMLETMNKISNNWMRNISPRPNLPSIDNKTVIGKTIQESLSKRWRILDQQQKYKQGIMIVESEAGTGKNFKVDILWHLTNREVFDVSCNEYMEKEDLLFSPEIDNEWTYRKPSNLVKWLQTPWSIIVLDEINTLRPWVSKLLNPLLDGRRYINDPQLWRIHAHPSVLIIGLMNPRYYRGTQELPQEAVSRARITGDEYPEALEEAYMNSKYIDGPIGKLTQEEFENYRNNYVIQQEKPNDKKLYNTFLALEKVTQVAKEIRKTYSATMKNEVDYDKELNFVFTIRDGNYVLQDFNATQDIKKSLKDVILTKIPDHNQKQVAENIIDEVCG